MTLFNLNNLKIYIKTVNFLYYDFYKTRIDAIVPLVRYNPCNKFKPLASPSLYLNYSTSKSTINHTETPYNIPVYEPADFKKKIKFVTVDLTMEKLNDNEGFFNQLSKVLLVGERYALLFRVAFIITLGDNNESKSDVSLHRMLGNQFGFPMASNDAEIIISIERVRNVILERLAISQELYNYDQDMTSYVQIVVYKLCYNGNVVPKIFKNLYNKDNLDSDSLKLVKQSKHTLALVDRKVLPLTMVWDQIMSSGVLIPNIVDGDGFIKHIYIDDDKNIDFLDIIKQTTLTTKLRLPDKKTFVILSEDKKYLTIFTPGAFKRKDGISFKFRYKVYSVLTGSHLMDAVDVGAAPNPKVFTRTIGNMTKVVECENQRVVNVNLDLALTPIKPRINRKKFYAANTFIGTLDLETYRDGETSKVYAIGFCTKNLGVKTYYIDEDNLNSDMLIEKCFEDLVSHKYRNFTFYVHNLGKFDIFFILKVLSDTNKYKIQILSRKEQILAVVIKSDYTIKKPKINKKTKQPLKDKNGNDIFVIVKIKYKIRLVDSYNILRHSLAELGKTYATEKVKGVFPYEFMNPKTLFYKGEKPDIRYYKPININLDSNNKITQDFYNMYNSIPSHWDAKEATLDYLRRDVISLFQVLEKFGERIFLDHSVQLTDSLTISSLALKIFFRRYYRNNIALINKDPIYTHIKQSYFGGVTEVYSPYGHNLYYYDVNSLYPWVALQPMPGLNCFYEDNIYKCNDNIYHLFGFYYCNVKTNNAYLGLLPFRLGSTILMPNGSWQGWYFSEELKLAVENGYTIEILRGYTFDKVEDVFKDYNNNFYEDKAKTEDPTKRSVAKSLLNNLLGRFGLDIYKSTTEILGNDAYQILSQTHKVEQVHVLSDEKVLVTWKIGVDRDVCDTLNVDYTKLSSVQFTESQATFNDVSIAITSAVTAYARIFMSKVKLDILKAGGKIYYTDTDCIVTNRRLPAHMVGKAMGQFKLEYYAVRAYFISSKLYLLVLANGDTVVRAKGVNNHQLTEQDFRELYRNKHVYTNRTQATRSFREGFVTIEGKKIRLFGDAYTKRVKLLDKNGCWYDTKPVNLA